MPVLTQAVPKYRKHRASGQAIVCISGRDHYLGPHGTKTSKLLYDRKILEWLAAGRPASETSPQAEITVKEVLAKWWTHSKRHYRKNGRSTGTAENFKPVITLVRRLYATVPATDFGPLALKALMTEMVELGQSRRYINDNMQRIKRIFRWAASEQMISPTVVQALATVSGLPKGRTAARESEPVVSVAESIVEKTLLHLPPVVADMVRLQRLTGARPGEICIMRPNDVDRSESMWRYTPTEHKTEHHGRQRVIFIGPRGQAILLPYLLRDAETHCFSPQDSERKRLEARHAKRTTPLRCGDRPGTNNRRIREKKLADNYTNDSYRRAIHRACEFAFDMPDELRRPSDDLDSDELNEVQRRAAEWRAEHCWSPNQLRHAMATDVRHKFGLEAAQCVLGHSRADVTQIYAEKNLQLAAQVAAAVG